MLTVVLLGSALTFPQGFKAGFCVDGWFCGSKTCLSQKKQPADSMLQSLFSVRVCVCVLFCSTIFDVMVVQPSVLILYKMLSKLGFVIRYTVCQGMSHSQM